jgi:glycosyltransferase involved in cell wall biosynthesis
MKNNIKYSLIIPCYNESKNIPLLLERCKKFSNNNTIELIIVNNGSTDDTETVLNNLLPSYNNFRTVKVKKNIGYGFGIIQGLKSAKGQVLGWTHADMQTDPYDFLKGIDFFKESNKNIFVKGKRHGRPFGDTFFTIGMSIFESILLRKKLWDINAQPTIFPKSFFESLKNPPNDFSLDLYFYYKALESNLEVNRFSVLFGERAHGVSHWNIDFSSKLKFIYRTINYSLKLKKYI